MLNQKISRREQEVLELVANEYTTPQIASELFLSRHTIDSHKKNLKTKLNVKNSAGMVRRGFELGLLRMMSQSNTQFIVLMFTLMSCGLQLSAQDEFITTWNIESDDELLTIPIQPGFTYDFTIEWGDGTTEHNATETPKHTYSKAGIYTVKISGNFPSIYLNNSGDKDKLLEIKQWGKIKWEAMNNAFFGASKMSLTASDVPDLTLVSNLSGTFRDCSVFNADLSSWDVSNIQSLSFTFLGAEKFNGNISNWNTSAVQSLLLTFEGASDFNRDISSWDVSQVTNMSGTFKDAISYNQPLGDWDVSAVGNFISTFENAQAFNQPLSNWDTGSATLMSSMFEDAVAFNQYIGEWDVADVILMNKTFLGASSFNRSVKEWRIENVSNLSQFLDGTSYGESNYENTLILWSVRPRQNNVTLGASNLTCCNCIGRETLISANNWNILDGGKVCGRPFLLTIRTDFDNEKRSSPVRPSIGTYSIDWENDGIIDQVGIERIGILPSHTYPTSGDHQIAIYGSDLEISGCGDENMISIDQWGDATWSILRCGFQNTTNFTYKANDHPRLENGIRLDRLFSNSGITDCNIGDWEVREVVDMSRMFHGASSFNSDLSSWRTENVEDMSQMFENADSFNQNINNWNVGRVNSFRNMFKDAISFNQPLENWNTSLADDMSQMFDNARSFNKPIGAWNTENVVTMSYMFSLAQAFDQNLDNWDVTSVEDFSFMFFGTTEFNGSLSNWNTASAENMSGMFALSDSFNQPVSHFNTSAVTDLSAMFSSTSAFNQDLSGWNVSNVKFFQFMFSGAIEFNGRLDGWITSSATDMSGMFRVANQFNQPTGHFQTGSVTDMWSMFGFAHQFNQELTNWNTTSVRNMSQMFAGALSFNQDLSLWNVRGVTEMDSIFASASNFDQSLGTWDILNVTSMRNALSNTNISRENYDATLTGWGEDWLSLQMDVELGVIGLEYCDGEPFRNRLIVIGWDIDGDQRNCAIIDPGPCTVATNNNYIGPNGGDWNTDSNWSRGEVPNECDIVSIGLNNEVSLSADALCYTLEVFPGSSLNVDGYELEVTAIIPN